MVGRTQSQTFNEAEQFLNEEIFNRQVLVARFLVAQFELFTNMCEGRSYNCIHWLSRNISKDHKGFSYEMLISIAANPFLPYEVRAAVLKLIIVLYVDRFPQVEKVGRAHIPEKLWVFRDVNESGLKEVSIPVIRDLNLLEDSSVLPHFALGAEHEFAKEENQLLSFKSDSKYYLLSRVGDEFLKHCAGSLVHEDEAQNMYLQSVLTCEQLLLSTGFKSSIKKLRALLGPAGRILDGRSDKDTAENYFSPTARRFVDQGGSNYEAVLGAKKKIIEMLTTTYELRENYQLGRILALFKSWADGPRPSLFGMRSAFKSNARLFVDEFKAAKEGKTVPLPRGHPLNAKLLVYFTKLCSIDTLDESRHLDLINLTGGGDLTSVLLDCMMYEDDNIFSAAFRLLNKYFSQRSNLCRNVSSIYLLDDEKVPLFKTVYNLKNECDQLGFYLRSFERWGVTSIVSSGKIDQSIFKKVQVTAKNLSSLLITDENSDALKATKETDGVELATISREESKTSESPSYVNTHYQHVYVMYNVIYSLLQRIFLMCFSNKQNSRSGAG